VMIAAAINDRLQRKLDYVEALPVNLIKTLRSTPPYPR